MAETTPAEAAQPNEPRQRVAAAAARRPGRAAARERDETVFVWPNLLVIEFIAAMVMMLSLIILGWLVNAPLEAHSNPDRTPNPSKAPWYFLNLQELLLHMHPALAGVIVPTAALIALAAIPYIDRDTDDVGKWFGQPNAIPIAIFTTIYTSIIIPIMLLLDEEQTCSVCNLKRLLESIAHATGLLVLTNILVSGVILPIIIMLGPIVILVIIMRRVWNANMREIMIGLFTGFVVTFMLLTISGTVFRGPGMHLYWPWNMPPSTD
ncbi:MAG TPA: menaquinol-cytochrome C reductase [Chloroflexota bacterium]|nr:menaquinol-cytochrome C reductase [Chloroflexota bacterium]